MDTQSADLESSPIQNLDHRQDIQGITVKYEYGSSPATLIINRTTSVLFIHSPILNCGLTRQWKQSTLHQEEMDSDDWEPLVELVRQELGVVFTATSFLGFWTQPTPTIEFEINLAEQFHIENRYGDAVVEVLRPLHE